MTGQQKKAEKLGIFSTRLRTRRERLGLQQNELAEKIGVKANSISAWERGDYFAKGKNLRKLAEGLSCDTAWLMGDVMELTEASVPYRAEPRMDFSLIFRTDSLDDLIRKLSGVLSDQGASLPARLANAEVIFIEIKARMRAQINSTTEARKDTKAGDALRLATGKLIGEVKSKS